MTGRSARTSCSRGIAAIGSNAITYRPIAIPTSSVDSIAAHTSGVGPPIVDAACAAFVGGGGDAVFVASGVMVVAAVAIFVLAPSPKAAPAAAEAHAAA